MTGVNASYPEYTGEISLRMLDHMLQNSMQGKFCQYSANFWTNGWYTPCTEYDLSSNTVPITTQLVDNNGICNENTNTGVIQNAASSSYKGHYEFFDGRTHAGASGLQGDNDNHAFFQMVGQLWRYGSISIDLNLFDGTWV